MRTLDIVIATKNRHKIREITAIWRQFLSRRGGRKTSRRLRKHIRFVQASSVPSVKENGKTYSENAAKKAIACAKYTGLPALAEDSGIEVRFLNWKPGIYSARYASSNTTNRFASLTARNSSDKQNISKLLGKLSGMVMPKRIARYRCSAVLASPQGKIIAKSEDACWGRIAQKPLGRNGFGYDPVFIPDIPHGIINSKFAIRNSQLATFGQLPVTYKHTISHRGKALRKIFQIFPQILDTL